MAGFSLGSLFQPRPQGAPAPAPAPQQPQGTPGSSMQQQNPGAGQVPATAPQEPSSPLDAFKDLWKTDASGANTPSDPFSQPLFQTDPSKILEAANKADFISQVPQELMQKAMSGQDPQAFMEVINKVAQQSLALSLQLNTATIEQAGTRIGDRYKKDLPNRFKELQVNSTAPQNQVLQHPAAQPMLQSLRDQIRKNNPDMPPDQITKQAEEFLTTFASQLAGSGKESTSSQGASGEQDWSQWG